MGFFLCTTWLVPFGFFISLAAIEVLPDPREGLGAVRSGDVIRLVGMACLCPVCRYGSNSREKKRSNVVLQHFRLGPDEVGDAGE